MVDKDWAGQSYIADNARARKTLETIAATQTDKAHDALSRTLFNQIIHQNESGYFQADEAAYNDSTLNAGEASLIEAGVAGEDNLISRYGTEHGRKPLEVPFSDSVVRLGSNIKQSAGAFYNAVTRDPLGLAVDTVNGLYEGAVTCVTTSKCIAPDQTHGTARDRQLVAELQGKAEVALAESADNLGGTLGKLVDVPGIKKITKPSGEAILDAVEDQARKHAKDWADGARPVKPKPKPRVIASPGPDVDGEMIGQDGPTYSGVRKGQVPVSNNNLQNAETSAHSSTNRIRLNNQLLGEEVAQGHAFSRHVLGEANGENEFAEFGVKTRDDFAKFIEQVSSNPTEVRAYSNGRIAIIDGKTKTVIIKNSTTGESTAFRPDFDVGFERYLKQLPKQQAPFDVVQ